MAEKYEYCRIVDSNDDMTCILRCEEPYRSREAWESRIEDAECAYGGYLCDSSGNLEADLADLSDGVESVNSSAWWEARSRESIVAWHKGVTHWLAWICDAELVGAEDLEEHTVGLTLEWI